MEVIKGKYQTTFKLEDFSLPEYEKFLKIKLLPNYSVEGSEFVVNNELLSMMGMGERNKKISFSKFHPRLFDYEEFIVKLALKKRKFAVFADCGLGKTFIFLEWIRYVKEIISSRLKILIISPLMVLEQTRQEQKKFYDKIDMVNIHESDFNSWLNSSDRVGIVNYDLFRNEINFAGKIGAIVVDESSIFKNEVGIIRTNIINASKGISYKLCCTATPAPNDREEYANHAYFLDQVRSHKEFFTRYFMNRNSGWILKPHSIDAFYRHLASFSIFLRDPKKYGFDDNLKDLKVPTIKEIPVELTKEQYSVARGMNKKRGSLGLLVSIGGISERTKYNQISKGFIYENGSKPVRMKSNKPGVILDIVNSHPGEQVMVWTVYDEEGEILREKFKENDYSVEHLTGKTKWDVRLSVIEDFKNGGIDILISKPRLLGFGLNFQNVSVVIFSGLDDSYEKYYQALRRVYRYGNINDISVYLPVTAFERPILQNVLRKKDNWEYDADYQERLYMRFLIDDLKEFANVGIGELKMENKEKQEKIEREKYILINDDNIEVLEDWEEDSVDFCIFSPPFASLFTYSSDIADMGNCGDLDDEFILNYKFFAKRLLKVMKPGRKVCVHVSQLPILKSITGYIGMKDFRGLVTQAMQESGFQSKGEVAIKKNQQMQSIVKHAPGLAMHIFKKDSNNCIPCYNDYVEIFEKPGENIVPVTPFQNGEMTGDDWIKVASGCWMISEEECDIRESDTLNTKVAKSEDDEKHICPLQLEVIRRFMKLYSNPGELILDPFSGIGSAGYVAMELKRKYLGIELKPEYFLESYKNLERSVRLKRGSLGLLNRRKRIE